MQPTVLAVAKVAQLRHDLTPPPTGQSLLLTIKCQQQIYLLLPRLQNRALMHVHYLSLELVTPLFTVNGGWLSTLNLL